MYLHLLLHVFFYVILKPTKSRRLDSSLLNLAARNIDGVLGRDDVVVGHLVHLLHKRRELLIRLDQHLLLRLLILA